MRTIYRDCRIARFVLSIGLLSLMVACAEPVEEGLVSLNGTELYVRTLGSGEPILVVHGGPVLEHGYLLPHLTPLSESHRLILYDQRLSGRSSADVDSADVSLDNFVADIEAVREHFGLKRFHLMGHSWGGFLAMQYALAHPRNLESLMLLNSMPPSADLWRREEQILLERADPADAADRAAILQTEAWANREAGAYQALYRISYRGQFHDPSKIDSLHFYIPDDLAERSRRFGFIAPDIMDFDLEPGLVGLDLPVLLLYGSDEPALEISGAALFRMLPRARLRTIPNAGHFPFVENQDRFMEEVTAFLSAVSD